MQRGSDRLSVHRDEEMKAELRGRLTAGHPTRTAEWQDPEPAADDDPEVAGGPVTPGDGTAVETLRDELARLLGRTAFPSRPGRLRLLLRDGQAPDDLVGLLDRLPSGHKYATAHELAEALVRVGEEA